MVPTIIDGEIRFYDALFSDLRRACEKYLCMMVNLSNCLDLLILSDTHTANILNTHCIKFVVENLTKISNENSLETKLNAKIMSQIIKVCQNFRGSEGHCLFLGL